MAISIILRRQLLKNYFRDFLIGSISTRAGDRALICSGFFQENRGSNYQASQEKNFANVLTTNNIQLVTVGIHNYAWMKSYRDFRNNMMNAGVNITSYRKTNTRWHAKVFILFNNNKPIFGIIGSSNITRPAFSTISPFNNECDVFLWADENEKICTWMNDMDEVDEYYEIIKAPYNIELNNNISIEDRLLSLEQEIMSSGLVLL